MIGNSVRRFSRIDFYADPGAACSDFRGSTISRTRSLGAAGGAHGDECGAWRVSLRYSWRRLPPACTPDPWPVRRRSRKAATLARLPQVNRLAA